MKFSKKSRNVIISETIFWISVGVVIVSAPPAPVTDESRFPQQALSPPEQMRDGQTLAEKSFVMKMISILEMKITQEQGLRRRFFWNRDYVFEGDIILQKDQALQLVKDKSLRKKRKITIVDTHRWELPINYKFDGGHTDLEREKIRTGIKHWENQTCLTFTNNDTYTGKSIVFVNDSACYSFVGKQPGNSDQTVSIGKQCTKKGTVAHEIGHVIGFWHEHARPDRDENVKIHYDNIFISDYYNFDKRTWAKMDNLGVPYDVGSLMHYSGETFSQSSDLTVESWNPLLQYTMGQREDLSFYDVKLANLAYCQAVCNTSELIEPCQNDGYQDPTNCSSCRCPDGLAGNSCEKVAQSYGSCGGTINLNSSSYLNLTTPGYPHSYPAGLRCYWLIQSPTGTTIQMEFNEPFMNSSYYCKTSKPYLPCVDFVEVRFTDNLGLTGGRFCCDDSYQRKQLLNPIVSHNNHSLVIFKSWKSGDRGVNISLSIASCGGCFNNVTSPQVTCLRKVERQCYNTWLSKIKLQSCSYWMWCETKYIYKTVSRPSICYEEEEYCCEGYSLENNKCVLNTTDESFPTSNQHPTTNSTSSNDTSAPENDPFSPEDFVTGWSTWSSWGECSITCGGCGLRQRHRECFDDCLGDNTETEPCSLQSCNVGSFIPVSCSKQTSYQYQCGLPFMPKTCTETSTIYYTQSANCCCGYEVDPVTNLCVLR